MSTATETLPPRLPVLEAKHICRGELSGARGTHCLMGWKIMYVDSNHHPLKDALVAVVEDFSGRKSIAAFNDDPANSKAKIASVWNRAARALGYVRRGEWFVLPKKARAAK